MLTIEFLGTGTSQGVPVIGSTHPVCLSKDPKDQRLRVSVVVQWENTHLVIDCGPDFRQQMIRSKCPKVDALFITHEHADHTAGLDDIRPFVFNQGAMPLYASQRVMNNLQKRFDYILNDENKYPGAPSVNTRIVDPKTPFLFRQKEIIPIEVLHHNLPVLGYRIDDFCYLTDVKLIPEQEKEKLTHLDVLVLSALRIEPHISHLNLEEALALIEELKPKQCYLTHLSHLIGFHEEVSKILPSNVFLAYDTLKITSY